MSRGPRCTWVVVEGSTGYSLAYGTRAGYARGRVWEITGGSCSWFRLGVGAVACRRGPWLRWFQVTAVLSEVKGLEVTPQAIADVPSGWGQLAQL